jgi:hypothetical protein
MSPSWAAWRLPRTVCMPSITAQIRVCEMRLWSTVRLACCLSDGYRGTRVMNAVGVRWLAVRRWAWCPPCWPGECFRRLALERGN